MRKGCLKTLHGAEIENFIEIFTQNWKIHATYDVFDYNTRYLSI